MKEILILLFLANTLAFPDWLITKVNVQSKLRVLPNGNLELTNGLVSRQFSTRPGFATVDFVSYEKKSSLIRAIQPEAIVIINGINYKIGGFQANMTRAYLNRTLLENISKPDPNAFVYVSHETKPIQPKFPYKPQRGAPGSTEWPPKGLHFLVHFKPPANLNLNVKITVNYELYDNVPIIAKWLTIKSQSKEHLKIGIHSVEVLSLNWQWAQQGYDWLQVVPDQPRGTKINWSHEENPDLGSFQPLLQCGYDKNFTLDLVNRQVFETYRVQEILVGSADPERVGLSLKRLKRLLAPQSQENPVYFHMTNGSSIAFRGVVDQLAEVGFEMIFYSFGSGFDLEQNNLTQLAADIAYANSKGLEVGGYDLIAWTRRTEDKWMAITNETFGACMASGWYDYLLDKVKRIRNVANLTAIETDGPYPGYTCHSTLHKYHQNDQDSTFQQSRLQAQFYIELHALGMYINQPDEYFFFGANKAAMGYNEGQFSLPRWTDLSISRQGMFDDTFRKIPTEGWMFLPLLNYEGGGPAAWFEPLKDHLIEFDFALAQYFGAGVQACYRGDRIFDTLETKAIVKYWVDFYKMYRNVLSGDLIHIRRADMQSIDGFLHVYPFLELSEVVRGLAFFFNPTNELIEDQVNVPLYYTGLNATVKVIREGNVDTAKDYELRRDYSIDLDLIIGAKSYTWILFQ